MVAQSVSTHYNVDIRDYVCTNPYLLNEKFVENVNEKMNFNVGIEGKLLLDFDIIQKKSHLKVSHLKDTAIYELNLIFASDVFEFVEEVNTEWFSYCVNMYFPLLSRLEIIFRKRIKKN